MKARIRVGRSMSVMGIGAVAGLLGVGLMLHGTARGDEQQGKVVRALDVKKMSRKDMPRRKVIVGSVVQDTTKRVRNLFCCGDDRGFVVSAAGADERPPGAEDSFAMIAAVVHVRPYPLPGSPVSRLRTEGIRAMSAGDPEKMAAAGFNLVLPWERILRNARKTTRPDDPVILKPEDLADEAVEHLRRWARKCVESNLIMIYMMYVADEESVRYLSGDLLGGPRKGDVTSAWPAHQYRRVVNDNGHMYKYAPCPLERRYWMGFIRPQLETVARVLNETGAVGGGALELETYCWGIYPGYSSQKTTFCYCDHCFWGFVKSLGKEEAGSEASHDETAANVEAGRRFDWLTQRGLLPRYEKSLEDRMTVLVKEMIEAVRKIKPDFVFGFYPYCPFWYYDALVRGSGTPQVPCLVFPGPEYGGGYLADASTIADFFGGCPTPASVGHLRRRRLPAMYAGGLWAGSKGGMSPHATATAMDRMLRGPDGYWIYKDLPEGETLDQFRKPFSTINQWTTQNPGPLPAGDLSRSAMPDAIKWVNEKKPDGIVVRDGRIVARYDGQCGEVRLVGADFDHVSAVAEGWKGRGSLPPLDESVFQSGRASIRFEPSAASHSPRSPYIDQRVPEAEQEKIYELSFWVKTGGASEPIRFWVGRANSSQHPDYMYYANYFLPPDHDWMCLRTPVTWGMYGGSPPLVLRFWCPPTDGKVWLDEVRLRPVQTRTIDVPLNPPAEAVNWGSVDWKLSPPDARCEARIVDAEDDHGLRERLYPGDSLAPLAAVVGLKPTLLRLKVYPSSAEPVILEDVQIRFTSKSK